MGFVTPTHIMPPWTLPAPIGAYLATGGDWRAIVLVFINIAISFLIYLPFFKMYDKNMLEIEKMVTGNLLILNLHAVILSDRLLSITSFTLKLEREIE